MTLKENHMRLIVFAILVLILTETGHQMYSLAVSPAYTTAYQGARIRFAGVQHGEFAERRKFGTTEGLWDTTFKYDLDKRGGGLPPVAGELTACFVPSETLAEQKTEFDSGADISEWLIDATAITNPIHEYEWESDSLSYRMEEWQLKWFFSISSEPTGGEIPTYYGRNSLKDLKVWFELDLTPVWYFEGTDTAYFCVATMRISDLTIGGRHYDNYEKTKNKECRTIPMSEAGGSILPIYYGLFGTSPAEKDASEYQGKKLNPDLFRDKVYTYFTLDDFGVNTFWTLTGRTWLADVVTVAVDVHVFVIGEWTVKEIQELEDYEEWGRQAKMGGSGVLGLQAWDWLTKSKQGRFTLLMIIIVVIIVLLAITVGPVLLYSLGTKRGKSMGMRR